MAVRVEKYIVRGDDYVVPLRHVKAACLGVGLGGPAVKLFIDDGRGYARWSTLKSFPHSSYCTADHAWKHATETARLINHHILRMEETRSRNTHRASRRN